MKAVRLHTRNDVESLVYEECPSPRIGPHELLVKVLAAGVTPAEVGWTLWESPDGKPRISPILCHEFSGVIVEAGQSVSKNLIPGTSVFAFTDFRRDGGLAEYAVALPSEVALKPRTVDHVHASALPMSALTAWQGLFEKGGLSAGERVLIHGAAGGVGAFAVQLARWKGAWVAGTASSRNMTFLRDLGCDQPIDYSTTSFENAVGKVDLVLDCVGKETVRRSWEVLKPGGRLVSIAALGVEPPRSDLRGLFFIVSPDERQLGKIAELVDGGKLRPYVNRVYPLQETKEAFKVGLVGHNRGKMVVQIERESRTS